MPAGHTVVTFTPEPADNVDYIRWSTYQDKERATVLTMAEQLMQCHAFLTGTDYASLVAVLRA